MQHRAGLDSVSPLHGERVFISPMDERVLHIVGAYGMLIETLLGILKLSSLILAFLANCLDQHRPMSSFINLMKVVSSQG